MERPFSTRGGHVRLSLYLRADVIVCGIISGPSRMMCLLFGSAGFSVAEAEKFLNLKRERGGGKKESNSTFVQKARVGEGCTRPEQKGKGRTR